MAKKKIYKKSSRIKTLTINNNKKNYSQNIIASSDNVLEQEEHIPKITIKNNNTLRLAIILILIFIIGIVITSAIFFNYKVIDYFVLNASVKIVDYPVAGLNTDSSGLIFGKTYPGGGGMRYFNIISNKEALVYMRTTGQLSKYISFSNNSFIILPGENVSITADLYVPKDMVPGNYTGKVHVYLLKP